MTRRTLSTPRSLRPLVLLLAAAAACAPAPPVPVCASLAPDGPDRPLSPAVTAEDTLDLPVVLLSPGASGVELLVRVDPVAEEGIVRFTSEDESAPSPAVAGAGVVLAPGARYRICFGDAPAALAFQGDRAPHGKVWARISTDRPVRAWIQGPDDGVGAPPGALRVAPGSSGRNVFLSGGNG